MRIHRPGRAPLATALVVTLAVLPGWSQRTRRVSVSVAGAQAEGTSDRPRISADGRLVVFTSNADGLVPEDTNGKPDVFVRDLETGSLSLVSATPDGVSGNGACLWPVISADGRFVAFSSLASDLVPGDSPGTSDTFVRDLRAGTTVRVTVNPQGGPANGGGRGSALSADGRYVAFSSGASNLVAGDTNGVDDVFVRDLRTGITELVSVSSDGDQADQACGGPWISADGRFVSFGSLASSLVEDDTNLMRDVFLRDRWFGKTTCVSRSASGEQGNSQSGFNHATGYDSTFLSPDARWIVFHSYASNLVPGDTNTLPDVFVVERNSGRVQRVSVASDGSQSNGASYFPEIFGDGRWVAFKSAASNLVLNDRNGVEDVFVHDRWTGVTSRVSMGGLGQEGELASDYPTTSHDGAVMVFESEATNLVEGDTNAAKDLFERRMALACAPPSLACGPPTPPPCSPRISWSGLPSASSAVPFELFAHGIAPEAQGLLLLAPSAPAMDLGGACRVPPWVARPLLASGGTAGTCEAAFKFDVSAFLDSAHPPCLVSGQSASVQFLVRGPRANSTTLSSHVVTFLLHP